LAFFDAAKAGKASYFHCRIGSDRTGYWGLLIEGMLGISPKDCSIDFELTGFARNVTSGDRERNNTGYLFYQGMEGSSSSSWGGGSSQPGFMQEENGVPKFEGSTLQEKITNYLVNQVGIDSAAIEEFKSLVLEDI
ncbi:MAG: tyrosine-protein phosphatase, partial [Bacteroidales bacterium]|nr:tyrosine-protein phosphatase [Bacteroidales bacterium]